MKTPGITTLKGKNVLKLMCIFALIPFLCCKATKKSVEIGQTCADCFEVKKFKRVDSAQKSILTFELYDYTQREKKIPFHFVIINDLVFMDNPLEVFPKNGKVDIMLSVPLKDDIKIHDIAVSKGDSLLIKAYFKDSGTVFEQ